MAAHVFLGHHPAGHELQGVGRGKILVHTDEMDPQRPFPAGTQTERYPLTHIFTDHAHTGDLAQRFHRAGREIASWLAGVLRIIHVDTDDVHPAHEHHVLTHFVADLLSQYGQGDKGHDAQSDGQYHAKTTLADDLSQAHAKKVRHCNHAVTIRTCILIVDS